jgi:hypothetical protein
VLLVNVARQVAHVQLLGLRRGTPPSVHMRAVACVP